MLSKRLLKIASFINKDDVIYDVGTDHGLLPCFLIINSLCKKAYAVDNKIGPLNKCKDNINKYHLNNNVIPKLSDGISDIDDDANVVIIAGIGFYSLKSILDNRDLSNRRFIVQINNNIYDFRKYLMDINCYIVNEDIVYDDGHYYIIIEFKFGKSINYSFEELYFGPILIKRKSQQFIDYLYKCKDKYISNNNKHHTELNIRLIEAINSILDNNL